MVWRGPLPSSLSHLRVGSWPFSVAKKHTVYEGVLPVRITMQHPKMCTFFGTCQR